MRKKFVIATRGSRLAFTQSEWVASEIRRHWPDVEIGLQVVKTTGDRLQTEALPGTVLDKGLFTKEIEEELLAGRADLAVHSCKDLPVESPEGLILGAIPPRAPVHDVLVLKKGGNPDSLPEGAVIYTGSLRRGYQWRARFPRTQVRPIRGNVDTRIQKLKDSGEGSGLLLAAAGLSRLKFSDDEVAFFDLALEWMLPAPAQGALAVQIRKEDAEAAGLVRLLDDKPSRLAIEAERAFLQAMGGGCQAPLGAFARPLASDKMELAGVYFSSGLDSGERHKVEGLQSAPRDLGQKLAERFRR